MRKLSFIVLFVLLSIVSMSHVMADYQLPSDTVDVTQPVAGFPCINLETSAGQGFVGFDPCNPCIGLGTQGFVVDDPCIDPCFNFDSPANTGNFDPCKPCPVSNTQGNIDDFNPCDFDPCKELEVHIPTIVPNAISLDLQGNEIVTLDTFLGILDEDCVDETNGELEREDSSDLDADGVVDKEDNCPTDYNPDQSNSYGGGAGDACEKVYQSENSLVFGFFGSDSIGLYGFCTEDGCQYISTAIPADFADVMNDSNTQEAGEFDPVLEGGKVLNVEEGNPSRMTVLFQVGTDADGNAVYQLNVYILQQQLNEDGEITVFPFLVDDDITIVVNSDGSYTWYDNNPN